MAEIRTCLAGEHPEADSGAPKLPRGLQTISGDEFDEGGMEGGFASWVSGA